MARPTKLNDEVRKKIEEAAALDCTLTEIALYADISRETLYQWMKEDQALSDRIKELKEQPFLKMRTTLVNALRDPKHARWYAAHKKRDEFHTKQEMDVETMPDIKLTVGAGHGTGFQPVRPAPVSAGGPTE